MTGKIMVEIKKNIPLPEPKRGRHAKGISKYPFNEMEVGDCIDLELLQSHAGSLASRYGRKVDRSYTTRKIGGGLTRVWRTA